VCSLYKEQKLVRSIQMDTKKPRNQTHVDLIFQEMRQIFQQRKHLVKWLLRLRKVQ
jgi:hypothetical protein